jgi:glycosyltransferase involved in cell wall biosynthesis
MNILYLTYFDLNQTCAGLNRANHISEALKKYGISITVVGSGCSKGRWEYKKINNQKQILYNRKFFSCLRHSKSMRYIAEASKFYKKHLIELFNNFNISGVIIYNPFGEMADPIIKISSQNKKFVVAELGEFYDLSVHNLCNGVIFQQFFFKNFLMKKLDGAIYAGEFWKKKTDQLGIPSIPIPTITKHKQRNFYRTIPAKKDEIFKIMFMGRLSSREVPNVIFEALSICKQRGLNFEFLIIGTRNQTFEEKYWIKKLKKNKVLKKSFKIFGFVSDKLRDRLQKEADIFVMLRPQTKEVERIFPFRIAEFLMSGNPCIVSNIAILKYYLKENKGIKFINSNNNPIDIANLIISLSKNPQHRYKIGLQGRYYAQKNFSYDVIGKKLSKFLFKYNLRVKKKESMLKSNRI